MSVESHRADRFWAHSEHGTFDAVLVDAPCSSDRHVLQQAATKGGAISRRDWSLRHCKECADLQVQVSCQAQGREGRLASAPQHTSAAEGASYPVVLLTRASCCRSTVTRAASS